MISIMAAFARAAAPRQGEVFVRTLFGLLALVACTSVVEEPIPNVPPADWDASIRLVTPADKNPDPKVLEIDLEARITDVEVLPGTRTKMWTYNGGLPGPLIRARVGDTLVVHFKNSLPEPTTIHWHGLRVPAAMDGNGMETVPSGGTFEYRFTLPDAGTFWYHPHHHSAAQVGNGLYGPLVVDDPADPALGAESIVVLSDASIEDDGTLLPPTTGGPIADLFGREGGYLLVNGRIRPKLRARKGVPIRLRMINASRSRYYRMALEGHELIVVGGDGGLLQTPHREPEVMLVPGERIDVVIEPKTSGLLKWLPFERGFGTAFAREPEPILDLEVLDLPGATPPPIPARFKTIPRLDPTGAKTHKIELTQMTVDGKTKLGINGVSNTTTLRAMVGETNILEVVNTTDAHHPFHLHGFFFQVEGSTDWKDTLNIPMKETRKVVVKYDDRPGMWMFHCHILDHADLGMMGMLEVVRDPSAPPTHSAH